MTDEATGGVPAETAPPPNVPADPRDATIASQQAEIDRLTGELEQAGVRNARSEGEVRADDEASIEERRDELIRQGLSEEDATEQAAYEARIRADQAAR